jgi:predicted MFS family arabinose efflux permease
MGTPRSALAPAQVATRLTGRAAFAVFSLFAGAYFLSYALRAINAVIAPELITRFGLTNAQLGALSSAYFLAFALMQLPLGVCLDRFGSRRTNALLLLVSAVGCLIFATAQDTAALWGGRALIGVGVCGALMSALKGYRFWYPPEHQGRLAAWMLVVGTGGAMMVTVPVELALPLLGWRGLFVLAAVALVIVSAGIALGVPRDEERSLAPPAGEPVWSGFGQVYRSAEFWRWAIVSLSMQSHFVALQSLWAGPWFTQVVGMSPGEAAAALFVFNGVLLAGFLGLGWAAPGFERRGWTVMHVAVAASLGFIGLQTAIALVDSRWAWLLWLPLGVVSTGFTLVQTHVAMIFPPSLTGRAFTGYNLLIFGGIFLHQWLFGVVADAFRASLGDAASAFRATLLVWVGLQLAAFLLLLVWRPRGSRPNPGAN